MSNMRYESETGNRALGMYVNCEHVDVSKELLIEIVQQIVKNCYNDGFDEMAVDDHAVSGMIKLFMDVADETGYHRLQRDLQRLSTGYNFCCSNCE